MKRNRATLILGLLLLAAAAAQAQFDASTNDGTITITSYTGSGGAVTIPSSITGMPVTCIGVAAFFDSSVTSVAIPNTVVGIGAGAFSDCYSLASVAIPNSVTTIGDSAFQYCTSLTGFTVPDSVVNIGVSAFENCTGLAAVAIPNSVTNLGGYAFGGCTSLANAILPGRIASIGDSAFWNCTGLASVTIANGVTSIGDYAFDGCSSLTSLTIPKSVTGLGDYAFTNCTALEALYFQGNAPNADLTVFAGDTATAYYLAGTTGWSTNFRGLPTVELNGISFTVNSTNGAAPLAVNFTSAGVDSAGSPVTLWNWVFGDGSTSTAQKPSHTYTNAGTFYPTLFATNAMGRTVIGSGPSSITAIGVMSPPSIGSIASVSGTNLAINALNGVIAATYYVLTSTNLALPLSQWTPVATNILCAGGSFRITVTNTIVSTAPRRFYILQSP